MKRRLTKVVTESVKRRFVSLFSFYFSFIWWYLKKFDRNWSVLNHVTRIIQIYLPNISRFCYLYKDSEKYISRCSPFFSSFMKKKNEWSNSRDIYSVLEILVYCGHLSFFEGGKLLSYVVSIWIRWKLVMKFKTYSSKVRRIQ